MEEMWRLYQFENVEGWLSLWREDKFLKKNKRGSMFIREERVVIEDSAKIVCPFASILPWNPKESGDFRGGGRRKIVWGNPICAPSNSQLLGHNAIIL